MSHFTVCSDLAIGLLTSWALSPLQTGKCEHHPTLLFVAQFRSQISMLGFVLPAPISYEEQTDFNMKEKQTILQKSQRVINSTWLRFLPY